MFVLILTCLVGLCSVVVVTDAFSSRNHFTGGLIAVFLLVILWRIDSYCWYRVFTDKHSVKLLPVQEQTEGVI